MIRSVGGCVTGALMSLLFGASAARGDEAPAAATAAPAAQKAASFEEASANARPVGDLKEFFGPLFADCKSDDELEARQCQAVRDYLIESRKNETFVAFGDESALAFQPYDPSEKKLEMEISGCIACGRPLKFDGDDRLHFVTTRVPKAIRAGRAVGLEVGFDDVALPDEKAAEGFIKKMTPRLRVQFLFKLGPVWKSGTGDKAFEGVTFVPLAHRVVDRCNGKVIASDPPSTGEATPTPDENCPIELTPEQQRARDEAALPDQLSRMQINQTMSTVRSKVRDCYTEFEVSGTATVKLVVGRSGLIEVMNILAPFDKTPTGYCIKTAMKQLTFPRFKGEKMIITYPFQLQ